MSVDACWRSAWPSLVLALVWRPDPLLAARASRAMGLAGAASGAVSGFVVDHFSYGTLAFVAALATVPLVAAALRRAVPAISV